MKVRGSTDVTFDRVQSVHQRGVTPPAVKITKDTDRINVAPNPATPGWE
jgi:hypothetical protein